MYVCMYVYIDVLCRIIPLEWGVDKILHWELCSIMGGIIQKKLSKSETIYQNFENEAIVKVFGSKGRKKKKKKVKKKPYLYVKTRIEGSS